MRVETVPVDVIFDLRWSVLRDGLPRDTAVYPEDARPETFHLAAYDDAGRVAGCVTLFPEPLPPEHPADAAGPVDAWRIRGMASAPDVRGQGYGAAVLRVGMTEAASRGATVIWCYGRTAAQDFYEHLGFKPSGDLLHPGPTFAPHYVFSQRVT